MHAGDGGGRTTDIAGAEERVGEAGRQLHVDILHADWFVFRTALKKAAGVSGGKDIYQVRLKGRERDYWMGTEIGMLGGYGFQGQVTAGDGSDKKGKMGAGYNNSRRKKKQQQCKLFSHC